MSEETKVQLDTPEAPADSAKGKEKRKGDNSQKVKIASGAAIGLSAVGSAFAGGHETSGVHVDGNAAMAATPQGPKEATGADVEGGTGSAATLQEQEADRDMPREAKGVNDHMSLEQAREAARNEVGPGGFFKWQNQAHSNYLPAEKEGIPADELKEHNELIKNAYLKAHPYSDDPDDDMDDEIVALDGEKGVDDSHIAHHVSDEMSDKDAWKIARAEVGPGGVYFHKGEWVSTSSQAEIKNMPETEREAYYKNVPHAAEAKVTSYDDKDFETVNVVHAEEPSGIVGRDDRPVSDDDDDVNKHAQQEDDDRSHNEDKKVHINIEGNGLVIEGDVTAGSNLNVHLPEPTPQIVNYIVLPDVTDDTNTVTPDGTEVTPVANVTEPVDPLVVPVANVTEPSEQPAVTGEAAPGNENEIVMSGRDFGVAIDSDHGKILEVMNDIVVEVHGNEAVVAMQDQETGRTVTSATAEGVSAVQVSTGEEVEAVVLVGNHTGVTEETPEDEVGTVTISDEPYVTGGDAAGTTEPAGDDGEVLIGEYTESPDEAETAAAEETAVGDDENAAIEDVSAGVVEHFDTNDAEVVEVAAEGAEGQMDETPGGDVVAVIEEPEVVAYGGDGNEYGSSDAGEMSDINGNDDVHDWAN